MLVILLGYEDVSFRNAVSSWAEKLFGTGMHQLNHYYESISAGRFHFVPAQESDGEADGIVSVTLAKAHPDTDSSAALHPDLSEALAAADPAVDFALYDDDGNGAVDYRELVIVFIVAGNEDAFSGPNDEPGVWAHQYCTGSADTPQLDGVTVLGCADDGRYALFGERHHEESLGVDEDATIGIIAHELGHAAFKLPDLYDLSGASAGIGLFGLMGSGLWGRQDDDDPYGNTPVPMCAWSKVAVGWVDPVIVSGTRTLMLPDTASDAYAVGLLPAGEQECFLLENRSTDGYDGGLVRLRGSYEGGLAIWHIDQAIIDAGSSLNLVNADVTHKGVDLEEAAEAYMDSYATYPGHAHNLFFSKSATTFSDATDPSSRRYDGNATGVTVTQISDPGPVMQAVVTFEEQ